LDRFGMGKTDDYCGDPTPFASLMALQRNLSEPIVLSVCFKGNVTKHNVSMDWRPEYTSGVRPVDEPYFEPESKDYEVFAGVTVMEMNENHILSLVRSGLHPTLGRWLLPENQRRQRLIITYIEKGTYASRVLSASMVVQTVNGLQVSTLSDFRRNFQPNGTAWQLETDQGLLFTVDYQATLAKQLSDATTHPEMRYLFTSAIGEATATVVPTHSPISGAELGANATSSYLEQNNNGAAQNTTIGLDASTAAQSNASAQVEEALAFATAAEKLALDAKAKALAIKSTLNAGVLHKTVAAEPGVKAVAS